jgi:hypothetical protein
MDWYSASSNRESTQVTGTHRLQIDGTSQYPDRRHDREFVALLFLASSEKLSPRQLREENTSFGNYRQSSNRKLNI